MGYENIENILKEACSEACMRELSRMPADDDPQLRNIKPSKGFEKNMSRLLADIRSGAFSRRYAEGSSDTAVMRRSADKRLRVSMRSSRRLKLIAIAVAMLLLLCACAAAYMAIEMKIHPAADHTDITFGTGSLSAGADADEGFQVFKPDVPDGYDVIEETEWAKGQYYICMADDDLHEIMYRQSVPDSSGIAINTEASGYTETEINGFKAIRYEPPGLIGYVWTDERYVYKISGSCSEELLLEVAESVVKKQ